MEQPISATLPGRRPMLMFRAAVGYGAILAILFYRLFCGEVLSPAAIAGFYPPFQTSRQDVLLYSNPYQWDIWTQVIPWEFEQYRHAAGIPLWNPHSYCGFPVFANGQSEFLNPTHWIYYFVNPDLARGPMAALRLWVSAMAMFMLLRRFGIGAGGAFLGGAVWVLSAFNIRWLLWAHTDASLTIPLILLALDCFLCRPTARRWAWVALAGMLLALSGHTSMQLMVGIVVGLYLSVRLAAQRVEGLAWPAVGLRLLGCVAAMLIALAGAAAAIVPQLQQIFGSFELAQGDRGTFPLPLKALWLFVLPNLMGWTRGNHAYVGPSNYFEASIWFGLMALALALAAAAAWGWGRLKRRKAEIPTWLGGFAILLVLVSLALAFDVTSHLPLIRSTRVVRNINFIRMFMGVHFGGAILAAIGADQILRGRSRAIALWTLVFMLAALGGGTVLFLHSDQVLFLRTLDYHSWALCSLDSSVRIVGGLVVGGLACAVLGGMVWSMRRGRKPAAAWQTALIAVAVADLLWVAWDFNSTSPRRLVLPPLPPAMREVIAAAGDGRIMGNIWTLTPNLAVMYDFRDVRGYDLPKSFRLGNLLAKLHLHADYGTYKEREAVAPVMDPLLAAWLNRCSVRFLLIAMKLDGLRVGHSGGGGGPVATPDAQPWPLVASMPRCFAYANPNAYPRAFIPVQARQDTAEAALGVMLDPKADLRRESIYESDPVVQLDKNQSGAASGTVRITVDHDEEVVLDVVTQTGGLVVLSDTMEPGWTVTVDGVSAEPLRANYLFRGVQVAPGHHVVRWTYRTPGLLVGGIVSGLTLLFLFGLVIARQKRTDGGTCWDSSPQRGARL